MNKWKTKRGKAIKERSQRIKFLSFIFAIFAIISGMAVFAMFSKREDVKEEKIDAEASVENQNNYVISEASISTQKKEEVKADTGDTQNITETKTASEKYKEEAQEILNEMSLEEKVCQMFIVTPEQLTGVKNVTAAGNTTKDSLREYPIGGLIYFSSNIVSREQITDMLSRSQEYALEIEGLPLFLCVDEEGGRVARISNNFSFGIGKIKPMSEVMSSEEAFAIGNEIGAYLSELGFNVDFAPDADVLTNSSNTVIGNRSFGNNADIVAEYAVAYSDGLHSHGVLSTFKHFPGHGATTDDTHNGFAYTYKSLSELSECELIPFQFAQKEEIDMVMVSHISLPGVLGDNTPCTLSNYMITEILRQDMGYDGIVITDAMNMGAITSNYNNTQAVIEAINAGVDIVLMPADFKEAVSAVAAAVENGEIDIRTIDESVERIIVKKLSLMEPF